MRGATAFAILTKGPPPEAGLNTARRLLAESACSSRRR